jgi:hypothetical protein
MIVPITLFGLIIIVWLQHTYMSYDEDKPLYRLIFNRIKLPIIYLCIVCIVYFYIQKPCKNTIVKVKSLFTDQKVFHNIPPF